MVLNTKPLVQVKAVDPDLPGSPDPVALAESTEAFLEAYEESELQAKKKIPLKIQTAVQQGDAVTYNMWRETTDRVYFYNDDGDLDWEDATTGTIRKDPVHYRNFYLWPLSIQDWQLDYLFVGHDGPEMTKSAYEAQLREWGVDESDILMLTSQGHSPDPAQDNQKQNDDIDPSAWSDDVFRITEIWYNGAIGPLDADKYKIQLDRERRKILRVGPNPLHCREHPYRPLRYKRRFNFAYSEGVAEELLMPQAIGSTIDNMSADNWKVTGNHVVFYDENNAPQGFFQDVYPGARYGVSGNPHENIMVEALGGPVEALEAARMHNDFRANRVTGLPPVLTGSGDPTMKSGADASSIMALISEAGRKFGYIDQTMKEDLSDEFTFDLKLFAQYAPDGFARSHISPERALHLEALKYIPPRGRSFANLRIEITAPSPSSNRETQKQHVLILTQMVDNYLAYVEDKGMKIYAAQGQQEQLLDLERQLFDYKTKLWQKVTELHELPGLVPLQPRLEDPTPDEQKIDQLRQQLVQATQQLQQLTQQIAVHERAAQLVAESAGTLDLASAQQQAQQDVQQMMNEDSPPPPGIMGGAAGGPPGPIGQAPGAPAGPPGNGGGPPIQ
jgi:hypothetical protein